VESVKKELICVEMYREEPRPITVDVRERDEIYDADPRPSTVDWSLAWSPIVDTKLAEPRPVIVEASSIGSMNVLMKFVRPVVVENSVAVETYDADPRPATVDCKLGKKSGAPRADEKVDIALPTKLVDAYPAEPRPATVDTRFGVDRNPEA
jgi:hypothetical protein